jgi:hypothetical protein
MSKEQTPRQPSRAGERDQSAGRASAPRRRVGRRGVLKVAAGTGAAVVAASGVYIQPSVRPLHIATAEAFSF